MGLLSSAQFFQSFVETKLDRHGILYRKVHETSDLTDTYVDEDGVRCRGFCGAYVDDLIVFSRLWSTASLGEGLNLRAKFSRFKLVK